MSDRLSELFPITDEDRRSLAASLASKEDTAAAIEARKLEIKQKAVRNRRFDAVINRFPSGREALVLGRPDRYEQASQFFGSF